MKIFSYAEIMEAPLGTVFYRLEGEYTLGQLDGPFVKDYQSEDDLFYHEAGPHWFNAGYMPRDPSNPRNQEHYAITNEGTREGLFEHDAKYLVMEDEDIARMVALLRGDFVHWGSSYGDSVCTGPFE